MRYDELKAKIERRVGPSGVTRIISLARDGKPIPTVLCLVQQSDGSFIVTRGDLRTIADPVSNDDGSTLQFANESEVCDWAWADMEPWLGKTPKYTAQQVREAHASGDRQRERMEKIKREWLRNRE